MPWPASYELDGKRPATVALSIPSLVLPSQLPLYVQDLRSSETQHYSVSLQLLDCDAKRVHYVEQMHHAEGKWLAAVSESMVIHVDMTAKKSSPFPPPVFKNIAAMREVHRILPVPPQVGHKIGIPARK